MNENGVNTCPLFIDGNWTDAGDVATEPVFNPSDGSVIARTPMCGETEVDSAVRVARAALPDWSATPVVDRARILFRYVHLLEENFEALSRLVTREHGKTLDRSPGVPCAAVSKSWNSPAVRLPAHGRFARADCQRDRLRHHTPARGGLRGDHPF